MAQYSTGLVSATAGSPTLTFDVDDDGNAPELTRYARSGSQIRIGDSAAYYTIAEVLSDTSAALTVNYPETVTDEEFEIVSDFTAARGYPLANQGDLHFADLYSRAMRLIDADANLGLSFQGSALDKDLTDAPVSPSDGDRYIVGDGASGDWSGHDGELATWDATGAAWTFEVPESGWFVLVVDETAFYVWDGDAWGAVALSVNNLAKAQPTPMFTVPDADENPSGDPVHLEARIYPSLGDFNGDAETAFTNAVSPLSEGGGATVGGANPVAVYNSADDAAYFKVFNGSTLDEPAAGGIPSSLGGAPVYLAAPEIASCTGRVHILYRWNLEVSGGEGEWRFMAL